MKCIRLEMEPPNSHRSNRNLCDIKGCHNETSDKKPFCIAHLDRLPYVQNLEKNLLDREHELVSAANNTRPRIKIDGIICRDILAALHHYGPMSDKKLGFLIEVRSSIINHYLRRLQNKKQIRVISSKNYKNRRIIALHRNKSSDEPN